MSDGMENIGEGIAGLLGFLADISAVVMAQDAGRQIGENLGAAGGSSSSRSTSTQQGALLLADAMLRDAFTSGAAAAVSDTASSKMLDPDVDFIDDVSAAPASDPFGLKDALSVNTAAKPGQKPPAV